MINFAAGEYLPAGVQRGPDRWLVSEQCRTKAPHVSISADSYKNSLKTQFFAAAGDADAAGVAVWA
jgi:hypothetical protein